MRIAGYYKKCTMSVISSSSSIFVEEYFDLDRNVDSFENIWRSYFFLEEYREDSLTLKKICAVKDFFERHQEMFQFSKFESDGVTYDMLPLLADDIFLYQWPTFELDVQFNPQHTLACLQFAANQIILDIINREQNTRFYKHRSPRISISIQNYYPLLPLINIRENLQGTMVSIRGCLTKMYSSHLLPDYKVFVCCKCKLQKVVKQINGQFFKAKMCSICGCKKLVFDEYSPYTTNILSQIIKIQETVANESEEPVAVEVELTNKLVNMFSLGDVLTVTGIVKVQQYKDTVMKDKTRENAFIIKAVAATTKINEIENLHIESLSKTSDIINKIKDHPNVFKLLILSLCPELHGQEIVKAALVLSLFGGSKHNSYTDDNINMLIVLNPGFKKYQVLKSCALRAPKGVYVDGSSACNLTVSHFKEKASSEYFIAVAGALPLANNGFCCIDDLHKLQSQWRVLTNAMLDKKISIVDSKHIKQIPIKLSLLASIQPNAFRYNKSKSLSENLNISGTLLSLFQLVFVLSDQPDKEHDKKLYDYTMDLQRKQFFPSFTPSHTFHSNCNNNSRNITLKKSLVNLSAEAIEVLPPSFLKIYIEYARKHIKPKLSDKAMMKLKSYLKTELEKNASYSITSIFKTLIKLTQARAKVELRKEATDSDVLDAIEVLEYTKISIVDCSTPNIPNNGKMTQKNVDRFFQLLEVEAKLLKKTMFSFAELKNICERKNLIIGNFRLFIEKLNENGHILLISNDTYKLNF